MSVCSVAQTGLQFLLLLFLMKICPTAVIIGMLGLAMTVLSLIVIHNTKSEHLHYDKLLTKWR